MESKVSESNGNRGRAFGKPAMHSCRPLKLYHGPSDLRYVITAEEFNYEPVIRCGPYTSEVPVRDDDTGSESWLPPGEPIELGFIVDPQPVVSNDWHIDEDDEEWDEHQFTSFGGEGRPASTSTASQGGART